MSGTGNLKVTDGYLKDFAQKKLAGFIGAITPSSSSADPSVLKLSEYAANSSSGSGSSSSSGPSATDPSLGENELLPGNPAALMSAGTLQGNFKTLATTLSTQMQNLVTSATTLSYDLLNVDDVLARSEDDSNITADEMTQDIANISLGGSGSSPSTSSPNPTGSSSNTK